MRILIFASTLLFLVSGALAQMKKTPTVLKQSLLFESKNHHGFKSRYELKVNGHQITINGSTIDPLLAPLVSRQIASAVKHARELKYNEKCNAGQVFINFQTTKHKIMRLTCLEEKKVNELYRDMRSFQLLARRSPIQHSKQ